MKAIRSRPLPVPAPTGGGLETRQGRLSILPAGQDANAAWLRMTRGRERGRARGDARYRLSMTSQPAIQNVGRSYAMQASQAEIGHLAESYPDSVILQSIRGCLP